MYTRILFHIQAYVLPEWTGFRSRGQWESVSLYPQAGDIVYFDFDGDGITEHVGIVQFAEGDNIITVEGNTDGTGSTTGNAVAQKVRNKSAVLGYGASGISSDKP